MTNCIVENSEICGLNALRIIGPFIISHDDFSPQVDAISSSDHPHLVIDLRNTSFFSSQGLASLIVALKHVTSAGGKMFVLGATKDMLNVFQLTLLDKVLLMAENEEELNLLKKKEII